MAWLPWRLPQGGVIMHVCFVLSILLKGLWLCERAPDSHGTSGCWLSPSCDEWCCRICWSEPCPPYPSSVVTARQPSVL